MNPYEFHTPTRIVFGRGVAARLAEMLQNLGGQRPLLVTDKGLTDCGLAAKLLENLRGMHPAVFDSVPSNPTDSTVAQALNVARAHNADCVVALGGGSPMDTAKAVSILLTNGGALHDYLGMDLVAKPGVPLIALPTTAGSGSEVTHWAVITDTRGEAPIKDAIGSRYACPSVALCDPELTSGLPERLTAYTGLDALTHAVEAFWAKNASPITDSLALAAIHGVAAHLPGAVKTGDMQHREGMLQASLLAGLAFSNADVGAVHAMGETLGGIYDLHHGLTMGLLLPYVMQANLPACSARLARLAMPLKAASPSPQSALDQTVALVKAMRVPALKDLNVPEDDLPRLAEFTAQHPSLESNPVDLGPAELLDILQRAYRDELGIAG